MDLKEFASLPPEGVAKMAKEISDERKKFTPRVPRPRDEKDQAESLAQLDNPKLSISVREGFRMRGNAIACDLCVYGEKWASEHSPECEKLEPLVLVQPDSQSDRVEVLDGTYLVWHSLAEWKEYWKQGKLRQIITVNLTTSTGQYVYAEEVFESKCQTFIEKAVQGITSYLEILEAGESLDEKPNQRIDC